MTESQGAHVEDLMLDDEVSIVRPEASALEAITRSEVSMQLEAAHRFPRSTQRFLREATGLATYTRGVAESCIYSLPRAGKMITGPSVRLAEIIASTWGNLHVGARVIDETDSVVIAQAIAWDLQRNLRLTVEAQRGILTSKGKRYDNDMIRVTGMAAMSIARRNVVFTVVPRSYVDAIYAEARACAVGDAKTLTARREEWLGRLARMGVGPERVFARLGVVGPADITLDHGALLIGLCNSIQRGDVDIDEAFPSLALASALGAPPATTGAAASPPSPSPSSGPSSGPTPPASSTPPAAAAAQAAPEGKRVPTGARRGRPPASAAPAKAEAPPAPPASSPPSVTQSPPTAAAEAAPAPTGVNQAELVAALQRVDDSWKAAPDAADIVAGWSEAEREQARAWTRAILDDGPMRDQAARPACTNIDEPPAEDMPT